MGNTFLTTHSTLGKGGSSPRVWGILLQRLQLGFAHRFIPTCVGNTIRYPDKCTSITVHPHVCGEYIGAGVLLFGLVWFIPTCVGNTASPSVSESASPVHPHVCGEYESGCDRDGRRTRFIPTCVGNTYILMRQGFPHYGSSPRVWGIPCQRVKLTVKMAVHPHVCGEYVELQLHPARDQRFIPTCVGNTPSASRRTLASIGSSPRVWGIHS